MSTPIYVAGGLGLRDLTRCHGTQDFLETNIFWVGDYLMPQVVAEVAKRLDLRKEYVDSVLQEPSWRADDGSLIGNWDWRVCREAYAIIMRLDLSICWVRKDRALQMKHIRPRLLQRGVRSGAIRAKKVGRHVFYHRQDVGLGPNERSQFPRNVERAIGRAAERAA